MSLEQRLQEFHPFSAEVLSAVSDAASAQKDLSFRELAGMHGLSDGLLTHVDPVTQKPFSFFTIKPLKPDYDYTKARVYYTPMAIPADESMAMRSIRLFAADPTTPLYVYGAPGAVGNRAGTMPLRHLPAVGRGDFGAAVMPSLRHLHVSGVRTAVFIGFSYGADRANAAAAAAVGITDHERIDASNGVFMEPVGIKYQSLFGLTQNFAKSGSQLEAYVDASQSPALTEARDIADTGFTRYVLGLGRITNLAIARGLTAGTFSETTDRALNAQPEMQVTLISGGNSEITPTLDVHYDVEQLKRIYANRIGMLVMRNMHHAGGDDINLHAAMVLQGLQHKPSAPSTF